MQRELESSRPPIRGIRSAMTRMICAATATAQIRRRRAQYRVPAIGRLCPAMMAIDADHLGQLPHAQRRCAVPQDRDQHHDRSNVDLGAEEAQRRRRRPRPAAIDRTAEAEAPVVLTPEAAGPATRLAPIGRGMNNAATPCAARAPCGVGEVAIIGQQQLVECGVAQRVSVQRMRPPRLEGADHNGQARTQ